LGGKRAIQGGVKIKQTVWKRCLRRCRLYQSASLF
jgi:hypothetical protein